MKNQNIVKQKFIYIYMTLKVYMYIYIQMYIIYILGLINEIHSIDEYTRVRGGYGVNRHESSII